jgi:asparagine synthase (glutamine-hydrolysing)
MARLLRTLPDGFWYKSLSHQLRWLNQVSLLEGGRRYASGLSYSYFPVELRRTLYGDGFVRAIDGFDPEGIFASYFDYDNADELVDKMLFTDSMVRLPDHSVMILDRTAMAHGLEARSPFLDHTLVEFVARIATSRRGWPPATCRPRSPAARSRGSHPLCPTCSPTSSAASTRRSSPILSSSPTAT